MYRTQIEKYKIISNLIFMAGILAFYLKQDSLAVLYIAGAVQVMILVTQLFWGNLSDVIEYLYVIMQKRGYMRDSKKILPVAIIYSLCATIIAIVLLLLCNEYLHAGADYPYASNIMLGFVVVIPLTALLQVLRGYLQIKYSYFVCGSLYIVQALLLVLLVLFGMNSSVEYGNKVAALLQNEHLVYLYVGERIVLYYAIVTVVFIVISAILLLIRPREKVKLLDYNALDGKQTKFGVFKIILEMILPRGIMSACLHVPFLLVYKLGCEQISTGNRLVGHFYGFMLPSILFAVLVAQFAYYMLEAKCSKDLRKKEPRARNYSLKLLLVYSVYSGMYILVVMVPSITRILSLLGFVKDTAVMQFYYASFLFAAFMIPLICFKRVLGIIGKQFSALVVHLLSTGLVILVIVFTDVNMTVSYMHIIGIVGMYFLIVTTLLFLLVLDRFKISIVAILPSFGCVILCAGATIAIFSLLTNWMVNTLGGIFVGYVTLILAGLVYTTLVLLFYVFTKGQAKILPGAKIYIEILELMGRRV